VTLQPLGLLPLAPDAASTTAPTEKLYQRVAMTDPERMSGSMVHYKSFADFATTFDEEAKDPNVVGAADVLDIINPFQHLPIISQIYREITNDHIKAGARMMGGTIFGGGVGLASSSVNAMVQEETGKDVSENIMTAMAGQESFVKQRAPLAIAATDTPEQQLTILADKLPLSRRSPQMVTTMYRTIAENVMEPKGRERVVMNDPERMAGSFTRYV
jgi:hypothetical protein